MRHLLILSSLALIGLTACGQGTQPATSTDTESDFSITTESECNSFIKLIQLNDELHYTKYLIQEEYFPLRLSTGSYHVDQFCLTKISQIYTR